MYLPAFHASEGYHPLSKKGYFALYHGNLSVTDNMKAALLLIEAFKPLDYPLVIDVCLVDASVLQVAIQVVQLVQVK